MERQNSNDSNQSSQHNPFQLLQVLNINEDYNSQSDPHQWQLP